MGVTLDEHCYRMKEACYESMVRPVVEYTSAVWSWSSFTNTYTSVQCRAARFVTSDYGFKASVTGMLAGCLWNVGEKSPELSCYLTFPTTPITTCTRGILRDLDRCRLI